MSRTVRTALYITIPLVIALVAGGWWWMRGSAPAAGGPGGAASAPGAGGPPPVSVTLFTAQKRDVPVTVDVNGSVMSLNSVDVRPQVSNMVEKVHVKEGQFVKAGELLITLDARADKANLDKAKAQQLKDEATLADLERTYARNQDLVGQKFIAQSAADNSLSQVQAQRAAVAADKAAVDAAAVAVGYDTLRSPISGRIGAISVYAGSLAQPASILVTVTQLDPIAVSFPVPEGSLQDLLAASKARSRVQASIPGNKTTLQGVLSFVDNTVDPTVGTVRAKAVFDNKAQLLWPGQYVNTSVTVNTLKDATVAPLAGVITGPNGKIVYVVGADMTVQPRKVLVAYSFGGLAAVQGLEAGEKIVIDGKQNLRTGSRVRVERAAERPAGAASAPASAPKKDPA